MKNLLDMRYWFAERCACSTLTRRAAVFNADNESAGETTENVVLVSNSVDGSCCRATSCEAFDASTFFVRSHAHRKNKMDSHEVLMEKEMCNVSVAITLVEMAALQQWNARRFKNEGNINDVARFAMWFALTNPEPFDDWMQQVSGYAIAEGIDQFKHVRGRIVARYRRKHLKLQTGGGL